MTNFDKLLENNKRFAATDFSEHLPEIPFIPNQQVYVLTCIDPRVDPAATLGLRLGDAIVARTVGGRANQSFLDDLAWISYLHETVTPDADWFELAVIHHTDCGSALMADDKLRRGFLQRGFEETPCGAPRSPIRPSQFPSTSTESCIRRPSRAVFVSRATAMTPPPVVSPSSRHRDPGTKGPPPR